MRGFTMLCVAASIALTTTLTLDVYQREIEAPGKTTIVFASMWAPGEPMQRAYEQIFREFE